MHPRGSDMSWQVRFGPLTSTPMNPRSRVTTCLECPHSLIFIIHRIFGEFSLRFIPRHLQFVQMHVEGRGVVAAVALAATADALSAVLVSAPLVCCCSSWSSRRLETLHVSSIESQATITFLSVSFLVTTPWTIWFFHDLGNKSVAFCCPKTFRA